MKIVGVLRVCKMCKKKFQPLSHNHFHCKDCQHDRKLKYYRKYNKTRGLKSVAYKFTHKKKNDNKITKHYSTKRYE